MRVFFKIKKMLKLKFTCTCSEENWNPAMIGIFFILVWFFDILHVAGADFSSQLCFTSLDLLSNRCKNRWFHKTQMSSKMHDGEFLPMHKLLKRAFVFIFLLQCALMNQNLKLLQSFSSGSFLHLPAVIF